MRLAAGPKRDEVDGFFVGAPGKDCNRVCEENGAQKIVSKKSMQAAAEKEGLTCEEFLPTTEGPTSYIDPAESLCYYTPADKDKDQLSCTNPPPITTTTPPPPPNCNSGIFAKDLVRGVVIMISARPSRVEEVWHDEGQVWIKAKDVITGQEKTRFGARDHVLPRAAQSLVAALEQTRATQSSPKQPRASPKQPRTKTRGERLEAKVRELERACKRRKKHKKRSSSSSSSNSSSSRAAPKAKTKARE